jgi:hypothetical protein
MAKPGETTHRVITILDAAGAPVTGLTLAAITVTAYGRGYASASWSSYDPAPVLSEIGGGDYGLALNLPVAAGWARIRVRPVVATRIVYSALWEGEVEPYDLEDIRTIGLQPLVLATQGALLGMVYPAELVAYRYNRWSIPVVDRNGAAVDLSAYSNLALAVRSQDQVTRKLDASNGSPANFVLTSSTNVLTVEWPETIGAGVADIYAHIPVGATQADPLYYEITADLGGVATKTVPLIRSSPLLMTRRELGS